MIKIPLMDVRNRSLVEVTKAHADKARDLIEKSKNAFGLASRLASGIALPLGDYFSRKWLDRTRNPYLAEIDEYAEILGMRGVYALNMCYEWGCTSGVYNVGGTPHLLRVLDWPFPGLGENMVVALQNDSAGEFYNITWPGVSGVFQAMAPGRFAISLNQAPMRRYRSGIILDWVRNRFLINRETGLPPAHLLRRAFEICPNYADVVRFLSTEPVSIPVLYTIAGTDEGQGCVIERLEHESVIRDMNSSQYTNPCVCVANHFESRLNGMGHGWLPRALKSNERSLAASRVNPDDIHDDFSWFKAPIANDLSRLALHANPASGSFSLIGTNGTSPVTEVFKL